MLSTVALAIPPEASAWSLGTARATLYVCDSYNDRILKLSLKGFPKQSLGSVLSHVQQYKSKKGSRPTKKQGIVLFSPPVGTIG